MLHQLVNHSPDLKLLHDEGYEVHIQGGHLLVSSIPYVNSRAEISLGTLVSTLTLLDNKTTVPDTHVTYFIGERPCDKNGLPINEIFHSDVSSALAPGIEPKVMFSSKPPEGYKDYHHKMTQYISIISAPAWSLNKKTTPKTFRVSEEIDNESVFRYIDSNSTRAGFENVSAKLNNQKIGIVGIGGTGAYILDLIAKTPVSEIHIFDGDTFLQHNAFRAPGAASNAELAERPLKVNYFDNIYSRMHKHIHCHDEFINESNLERLRGLDFIFICIDKGSSKKLIFDFLNSCNKPFIDVGMGLSLHDDSILGVIRTTTSTPQNRGHIPGLVSFADGEEDAYVSNIQIADLNMLNAAFAVIRWKKIMGFYNDFENELNSTYTINVNMLT